MSANSQIDATKNNTNFKNMHTDSKQQDTANDANNVLAEGLSLIQAKEAAMIEGKKIRHRSFMDHEYIYYKNGCWFTHDDYQIPEVCFLNTEEQGWWDNGWSVVS